MQDNNDFDHYEMIDVKLPRKQYQQLEKMIQREESISWLLGWVRNIFILTLGAGLVTVMGLWDWVKAH